ncbi:MAG: peroxidase-related enzyme [Pseudomonadota bacterium]|nr:peroxidase-related enzyme [Pseudomonadota bacterium]
MDKSMESKTLEQKKGVKLSDFPRDIADRISKVHEKSGFVPNVFLKMAERPSEFRAFFAYHDALMEKPDGLSKADRELIVVVTSALNNCTYCVVAHGAILRVRSKNRYISDKVAVNYRHADLSVRQRLMLDFAVKVAEDSKNLCNGDFDLLKDNDFSTDDIRDIISITAFFAMSNRLANSLFIEPNEEFYSIGR